jgi:hypothetical protein
MAIRLWSKSCGLLIALWPLVAFSGDGKFEINQACVTLGCFPGDPAGFPITITSPGSYILTGNVTLSSAGTAANAIEIRADDVSIDLDGFAIRCLRTIAPPGPCKGQTGGGDAIEIVSGRNIHIANGTVRDFPQHGINATAVSASYSLDAVRAINNGMNGIDSGGSAQILRVFATDNGQNGLLLRSGGAIVLDAYTSNNGAGGIRDLGSDAAIGRGQFRDGTNSITSADLLECIIDGVTQVCPP